MRLRLASLADEKRLLKWRNDPATRRACLTQHIISRDEHARWLRETLSNPNRSLFIAEIAGIPVGTIRVDTETDCYYLSWTIAPLLRHHGLGKKMVETLNLTGIMPIRAVIKKDNLPSAKLALHLGMQVQREERGILVFARQ